MKRLTLILVAVGALAVAAFAATQTDAVQGQAADDCCCTPPECCAEVCPDGTTCP
jgi:hypothetical protein